MKTQKNVSQMTPINNNLCAAHRAIAVMPALIVIVRHSEAVCIKPKSDN